MPSSRTSAGAITRTRSTNGCLVCRLRGKKCVRLRSGDTCSDCSHFRLVCHEQIGSIPSGMRGHPACQEAREEIREATDTARSRSFDHPLPATGAFAELIKKPPLNRGSIPTPESKQHRLVLPQCHAVSHDESDHLTSPLNSSGTMESFPLAGRNHSAPLVPYSSNPPSESHLPLTPPLSNPDGPADDAPDQVVYPLQSPVSMNTILSGLGAVRDPSRSLIPTHPYQPQVASAHPDFEAIIENLKPLLWGYGYELVPFTREGRFA